MHHFQNPDKTSTTFKMVNGLLYKCQVNTKSAHNILQEVFKFTFQVVNIPHMQAKQVFNDWSKIEAWVGRRLKEVRQFEHFFHESKAIYIYIITYIGWLMLQAQCSCIGMFSLPPDVTRMRPRTRLFHPGSHVSRHTDARWHISRCTSPLSRDNLQPQKGDRLNTWKQKQWDLHFQKTFSN